MIYKTREEALAAIGETRKLLNKQINVPIMGTDDHFPFLIKDMLPNMHPQINNRFVILVKIVGLVVYDREYWLELDFILGSNPHLNELISREDVNFFP